MDKTSLLSLTLYPWSFKRCCGAVLFCFCSSNESWMMLAVKFCAARDTRRVLQHQNVISPATTVPAWADTSTSSLQSYIFAVKPTKLEIVLCQLIRNLYSGFNAENSTKSTGDKKQCELSNVCQPAQAPAKPQLQAGLHAHDTYRGHKVFQALQECCKFLWVLSCHDVS